MNENANHVNYSKHKTKCLQGILDTKLHFFCTYDLSMKITWMNSNGILSNIINYLKRCPFPFIQAGGKLEIVIFLKDRVGHGASASSKHKSS